MRIGLVSLLCGAAFIAGFDQFTTLAVGMAFLGTGLGLCMPAISAGASLAVSTEEQGGAAGLIAACPALGFTVGPVIAGPWRRCSVPAYSSSSLSIWYSRHAASNLWHDRHKPLLEWRMRLMVRIPLLLAMVAVTTACATADQAPVAEVPEIRPGILQGYLPMDAPLDSNAFVPPPPEPGSPEQAADDAFSAHMMSLRGTARWELAAADAHLGFPAATTPAHLASRFPNRRHRPCTC